jgi:hypothetical protein
MVQNNIICQLIWLMPGFGDKLCNKQDELKLAWLCKRIENMSFANKLIHHQKWT